MSACNCKHPTVEQVVTRTFCRICGGEKRSSLAAMPGSVRASVRLKISDWQELINFVTGDLHNMPHDDPNAQKMNTILDAIRLSIVKAQNVRISDGGRET